MSGANIPDFRLELAGLDLRGSIYDEAAKAVTKIVDITAKVRPRLIGLSLVEKRGGEADALDLLLDDSDGKLALPPMGATLRLSLGWKQGAGVTPGLVDKGAFIVDEIQHSGPPDQVTLRAHSADFTGDLKIRREHGYRDTTLGAIVAQVAARHALKPRCAAALASIAVPAKAQSRESDMAFLRRLGHEHDAVATIKAGTLILSPIGASTTAGGAALGAIALTRRDGDRHSYRIEKRDEAQGVTASWHDRKGAKKQHVTVGKADGARKLSRTYATEAEARRAATAALGRAKRQPCKLDLTLALGRADLYPETKVVVSGFKAEIDAVSWLLAEIRHDLSDRGYTVALSLESA